MMENKTITVAYGDGIGPEIMEATLFILKEAGARINIEVIDIGETLYLNGYSSGISEEAWEVVKKNRILLKSPITTPQGKGVKSLNVTFRKGLGLFANVRHAISYHPFVKSNHPKMDMVVIRENEEDLYAGIEYRLTSNTNLTLKLCTYQGCEKIVRYAFEYARLNNRKKVTCVSKDNIMKITDGIFHSIFNQVAAEYPEIKTDHFIVDIGAARVAVKPESFDVIVTLNLYGDILSDIAAEISGSIGLAGSANIGKKYAMFEAIHGSAPDIAGKKIANPSGLLQAAIMMLEYIGQVDVAVKIQNAWLKTIEEGYHTADIYKESVSQKKLNTIEFANAVVANLGLLPSKLPKVQPKEDKVISIPRIELRTCNKEIIGCDVHICSILIDPKKIDDLVTDVSNVMFLELISQRGIKVWPENQVEDTDYDNWCLRFMSKDERYKITQKDIIRLLDRITDAGIEITMVNKLYAFENIAGFSKAQGD